MIRFGSGVLAKACFNCVVLNRCRISEMKRPIFFDDVILYHPCHIFGVAVGFLLLACQLVGCYCGISYGRCSLSVFLSAAERTLVIELESVLNLECQCARENDSLKFQGLVLLDSDFHVCSKLMMTGS